MHGWRPRSRRCRWACSRCWCGYPSWRRQAPGWWRIPTAAMYPSPNCIFTEHSLPPACRPDRNSCSGFLLGNVCESGDDLVDASVRLQQWPGAGQQPFLLAHRHPDVADDHIQHWCRQRRHCPTGSVRRCKHRSWLLRRILSVDLKQTDAIALRVNDIKGTVSVNPHRRWAANVPVFDRARIKCVERLSVVTEDLHLVKNWITDINIVLAVNSQSGAAICIGQIHGAQEMPSCIQNLNPRVAHIKDEQLTAGDHNLRRQSELARMVATTPDSQLANESSALVHDNNHVPLSVAHIDVCRSSIDRDPGWATEVRFSSSQFSEVPAKLSSRVVDEYISVVLVAHVEIVLTVNGE